MGKQKQKAVKAYCVHYAQTEYRTCTVFATSKAEARKKWRADDTQEDNFVETGGDQRIVGVDEMEEVSRG